MKLNHYIDHTVLKATTTPQDIHHLCSEAKDHHFYAVCVNGCYVDLASSLLLNSGVKIAAVIGFPLGAMSTNVKVAEAKDCVEQGADEIDMVLNIGLLKAGRNKEVEDEIALIKAAIGDAVLKVIIETCYLSEEEKRQGCLAALKGKANFVKTSTGFGPGGASLEDIKLIKEVVGDQLQIKASGGIKNRETALQFIKAGAGRIGTSSGISLVNTAEEE